MFNPQQIVIDNFVRELRLAYEETYSRLKPEFGNLLAWAGRLALENIVNSDALYHNVDHTIMVSMVGQAILKGKHLAEGGITPRDWMHFMMALLCHDIGYVRGVCRADSGNVYATGTSDHTVELSAEGTDAALTPFHVDRSKLFVRERFEKTLLEDVDTDEICSFIEMTRFPVPKEEAYQATDGYAALVRAADFIGQLGDPSYLKKIPALFYEFEETGVNSKTGYQSPGHMRRNYTNFYWKVVRPYNHDALRYLRVTQEGRQWIANLNSHIFEVEHGEG